MSDFMVYSYTIDMKVYMKSYITIKRNCQRKASISSSNELKVFDTEFRDNTKSCADLTSRRGSEASEFSDERQK